MKVFNSLDNVNIEENLVVALGTFDGIHIGHRTIISDAVSVAKSKGIKSACYTFANHPGNFIRGLVPSDEGAVKLLCTEEDKIKLLEELGVDYVFNVPFDKNIMTMPPKDFIKNILIDTLRADTVCCGFNYTFGDRALGNVDLLRSYGKELGLCVNVHEPVLFDKDIVSSTSVRALIREGKLETAARFLQRFYRINGVVSHGKKLGRIIGYPTMNFPAPAFLELPPNGVYFTKILVDGINYDAITNIGIKPTVGGQEKTIETFIFDFDKDVYGKNVEVELLKLHRHETKFNSIEALQVQISKDCNEAIEFHKKRDLLNI